MKTGCSTAAHGRLAVGQLTGPVTPEAPVEKNGLRPDVTAAKKRLEEAFRAWAAWAGIRPEGSEPPRWLLTIAYVPELEPSSDPESDWLLTSGGYHVGSVHRPLGPQNDPHWKLWVLGRRVAAGALRGAGLRRNRG